MDASNYIFSELGSKIFDTINGERPAFEDDVMDYIENIVFQVSNLRSNLNIEVRDLVESKTISTFDNREIKLLISMLCISYFLDKGVEGDQTADERLHKYLIKIWGHDYRDLLERHSIISSLLRDTQYKLSLLCQDQSDEEETVITFSDLS